MGVPGFFLWLMKNYKKEGFVFQKEKLVIQDVDEVTKKFQNSSILPEMLEKVSRTNKFNQELKTDIESIDYLLIDANCLIHPVCFKTVADNPDLKGSNLESKMMESVINYIEKLIDYVKPKKGIYIAIDGVAPIAKIKQQRMRRFKSIADKKLWDTIKKKHDRPLPNYWNNNAVTPGTVFMNNLHNYILEWSKNSLNKSDFSPKKIIYSSCLTPAEGEHKLLQFIRNNQNHKIDLSYIIYGLDADLIFLALSTNSNKIYLLREANEINRKESKDILNYVSIKIMRDCIYSTIKDYLREDSQGLLNMDKDMGTYKFDNLKEMNIVNDFIFMCYLLGNDFLPHIPSLDIHNNGIENLIINYVSTLNELILENNKITYLLKTIKTNVIKINDKFFTKFINKLGSLEEGIFRENFAHGRRRMTSNSDDLYEKEIFKIENLQFKIVDPIKLGSDNPEEWRKRYYKHYWDVEEDEIESFSENLVSHYLIGIKWITQYYFDKCPSWDWYYPYDHPPFITDIDKYLEKIRMNKIKFELGKPIKPFIQLLAVLPPQSNYLLPDSLKKLVLNSKSSLAYMYPQEFNQDFINKNKHWMGIPMLPPLDMDLIKKSYYKYQDEIKPEDQIRNTYKKVYEFN
jgi:5'-3' exonuclease